MASYPRHNAYGIYLVDTLGGRELIYRNADISCLEPLPIQPRPMPPARSAASLASSSPSAPAADSPTQAKGVFFSQDIYRSTQNVPRGTIRRLRVNEIIPQPTQRVPYSSATFFRGAQAGRRHGAG